MRYTAHVAGLIVSIRINTEFCAIRLLVGAAGPYIACGQSSRKYAARLPFTAVTIKICTIILLSIVILYMPTVPIMSVGKEESV